MKVQSFLEELTSKGWKQKDIAKKSNLDAAQICRIIKGEFVHIQTAEKIARAFDIPLKVFLDEDSRPERILTRKEEILLELVKGDEEIINEVIKCAEKEKLYSEMKRRKAA